MKKQFETKLTWKGTDEEFEAIIKVTDSGWGEVYDKASGCYCGSLNPIRIMQMQKGK